MVNCSSLTGLLRVITPVRSDVTLSTLQNIPLVVVFTTSITSSAASIIQSSAANSLSCEPVTRVSVISVIPTGLNALKVEALGSVPSKVNIPRPDTPVSIHIFVSPIPAPLRVILSLLVIVSPVVVILKSPSASWMFIGLAPASVFIAARVTEKSACPDEIIVPSCL